MVLMYHECGDKMKNKVVLIGCGNVGMSYAYALLNQRTYVNELVLIDKDTKRVEGEVMDLNHCLAFAPSKIDIKTGDSVIVLCDKEKGIALLKADAIEDLSDKVFSKGEEK